MKKAILIQSDDWEGLYVDGKLVDEGHTLNQGSSRVKYFGKLAKKYDFNLDKMKEIYLENDDIEDTENKGNFPKLLNGFIHNYKEEAYLEEMDDLYDVLKDNCKWLVGRTPKCKHRDNEDSVCDIDDCPIVNNL